MKLLTPTLTSLFALSLVACQTTGSIKSADETLLSAIPAEKISTEGAAITQLSTSNPTCVEFYKNTATYVEAYNAQSEIVPKAPGGGFAMGLLKTVAFGTVAGAASGGIGSLGIGSSFLELALAGAANQVVFQGSNAALDAVTGGGATDVVEAPALSPLSQIEAAAAKIGCPAPDAESLGLDPVSVPVGGEATDGHTHSAGEHTHTTNGQTYTHTH